MAMFLLIFQNFIYLLFYLLLFVIVRVAIVGVSVSNWSPEQLCSSELVGAAVANWTCGLERPSFLLQLSEISVAATHFLSFGGISTVELRHCVQMFCTEYGLLGSGR